MLSGRYSCLAIADLFARARPLSLAPAFGVGGGTRPLIAQRNSWNGGSGSGGCDGTGRGSTCTGGWSTNHHFSTLRGTFRA
ncbi:hypothetical protein JB92DRAFT_3050099 [Gautieria morchelliformis]|nr:hypothetical protein JB92DRAFT_3050099 [Gautieria morchelliformis]